MTRRHLVLIGLMGAGKTTVGQRCATELGCGFVDTDDVVAANAGMTVPEIFATEGEAGFRTRERAALTDVLASPEPLVVACGGGAMTEPGNRRAVQDQFVVWLVAEPEVLAARATVDGLDARPLLRGRDPVVALERIGRDRAAGYEAAADDIVTTEGGPWTRSFAWSSNGSGGHRYDHGAGGARSGLRRRRRGRRARERRRSRRGPPPRGDRQPTGSGGPVCRCGPRGHRRSHRGLPDGRRRGAQVARDRRRPLPPVR